MFQKLSNIANTYVGYGNFLGESVGKYILTPAGFREGIQGFSFDIISDHSISGDSDITDHYAEDNKFIQDHIALRPRLIQMRGVIGELSTNTQAMIGDGSNYRASSVINDILQKSAIAAPLVPKIGNKAQKLLNNLQEAYNTASMVAATTVNLWELYAGKSYETKQQKAFAYLDDIRTSRTKCVVVTPFGTFDNMYITSLRANQSNTKDVSDFTVELKELRLPMRPDTKKSPKVAAQGGEKEDKGFLKTAVKNIKGVFL